MFLGGGAFAVAFALVLGCGDVYDSMVDADDSSVEFRSGGSSTEIAVDFVDDEHACFLLSYACDHPESVEFEVDSAVAMEWHRHHEDGSEVEEPPVRYCHQTHKLSSGTHSFAVTATCGGTPSSDSLNASTSPPGFRIGYIAANQPSYAKDDTISLYVKAGADNLDVSASFASVDSTYTANSEQVTALGGGDYRIEYTISTSNVQRIGDKTVVVVVSDGSKTKFRPLRLRYLENGFPRTSLTTGRFYPASPPPRQSHADTTIRNLTIGARPASSTDDPALFESAGDVDGARPLVIEFDTEFQQDPPDTVLIEVRDPDRDGYFAEMLPITDVDCRPPGPPGPPAGGCSLEATGLLADEPHGIQPGQPIGDIDVRVVRSNGEASPWAQSGVIGCGCSAGIVQVTGNIRYMFDECIPDLADESDTTPQFYASTCTEVTRPARRIMVELVALGTSGQILLRDRTHASENGGFLLQVPDTGAELLHLIRVWTVTPKSPGRRVAVGEWQGPPVSDPENLSETLTDDPQDYEVHSGILWGFFPDQDAIPQSWGYYKSLPNLNIQLSGATEDVAWATHIVDSTLRSIEYFDRFVDVSEMHWMNVHWSSSDIGLGWNENVKSVHPSLIVYRPRSTDAWIVKHEMAHYFHRNYMRNDGRYGRFKEPMANVNASGAMREHAPVTSLGPLWWGSWGVPISASYDGTREVLDFNAHHKGGDITESDAKFFPGSASYEDCDNRPECCKYNETDGDPAKIPECVLGSMGWVWRIFWDMHDSTGSEPWLPDGMSQDFGDVEGGGGSADPANHKIMDVLFEYLGGKKHPENNAYVDRGLEHVDIVDVLDGMMCRGHMTQAQAEVMLHDVMSFEYDFDPPTGNCT